MKKIIFPGIFILFLAAGCGSSDKGGQSIDRKISKLESDIQILQQSVEMQNKQIKTLTAAVANFKSQVESADLGSINDLKARIKTLEIDASGFEK